MTPQELVDRLGALDAAEMEDLTDRAADALAYYQCRETNPKADDPHMGYHAFSQDQRDWLRGKKSEAAGEVARMIAEGRTLGVVAGRIVADMLNRHTPEGGYLIDGEVCGYCSDDEHEVAYPCPDVEAAERITREAGL